MSFFIYKSHISLPIRTISLQVDLNLPTTLIYHIAIAQLFTEYIAVETTAPAVSYHLVLSSASSLGFTS